VSAVQTKFFPGADLEQVRARVRDLATAEEEKMRAKGATDADIAEDVCKVMIAEAVTGALRTELGPDRYTTVYREAWDKFVKTATPEQLRTLARLKRKAAENGAAGYLEFVANWREWEGEP
jgi:hypothetical protein